MVQWWKRLLFSLLSAVVAGPTVGALWYCMGGLRPPGAPLELEGLGAYAFLVLYSGAPAWLLAVPMVLAIRNHQGLRLAWILPLGCCIGPLWIGVMDFFWHTNDPQSIGLVRSDPVVWKIASSVSALATSIYVLLVRRAHRGKNGDAESASPQVASIP